MAEALATAACFLLAIHGDRRWYRLVSVGRLVKAADYDAYAEPGKRLPAESPPEDESHCDADEYHGDDFEHHAGDQRVALLCVHGLCGGKNVQPCERKLL